MIFGGLPKGLGLAAIAALALSQTADAAIQPRQTNEALRPWVTVAADGTSQTITPTIKDGKTTSAFPGSTTTPTADAKGAGSFLLCNQAAGSGGLDEPFCSPKVDSELEGGRTYWITWDTALFPSPKTMIQIQGDFNATDTIEPGHGFTSLLLPASQGHFAWAAAGYNMAPNEALEVRLFLAITANNGTITGRHGGPRVRVVNRSRKDSGERGRGRRGPNVLAIVLPLVLGGLALGGIGWFVWWYGRRRGMFSSRGRGYGIGQSRSQRAVDAKLGLGGGAFSSPDRGVEMMPPPPKPPTLSGDNVFRKELNRQERNEQAHQNMV
ncbi:hypothetical protein CGRA01v4_07961 [Colletotrichum graminicola]|uniref:Uncharacterized protein n=1 Tax=Colletotrichum graminicola (strain M1.001 / M2 / FGSC 10212) TaxID=645133 RepID=E3Q7V2_COLGM|nr:uncharacterized protein GLRG_02135 [Colletotrichum graminicola M1.001]EFQ26964.1 hypothetical protein GLRG_02135 [Colletotrichum graminicola M1.001]WDK16678.1 hypothetical protein CGRA01v4_07961 [Colletotrichum graminicola]